MRALKPDTHLPSPGILNPVYFIIRFTSSRADAQSLPTERLTPYLGRDYPGALAGAARAHVSVSCDPHLRHLMLGHYVNLIVLLDGYSRAAAAVCLGGASA